MLDIYCPFCFYINIVSKNFGKIPICNKPQGTSDPFGGK